MSDAIQPELRAQIHARLDLLIAALDAGAPAAHALATARPIDPGLHRRHAIEAVLRIRLARVAHGKLAPALAAIDPAAAQPWAQAAEAGQQDERAWLQALHRLGVIEAAVDVQRPMVSTQLWQGYLYYTLEHEGPRGVLCEAYLAAHLAQHAPWNVDVRPAGETAPDAGAEARATVLWNALMAVVRSPDDVARINDHLDIGYGLWLAYFQELAALTRPDLAGPPAEPASVAVHGAQKLGSDVS
jgi:hypothetical protein